MRAGEAVALPTETVYGLGGLTMLPGAVRRIYELKGRPADNPLIAHVLDAAGAQRVAATWPPAADRLAARFWPGPLTLVVPRHASVPLEATGGRDTIAVRSPQHPVARRLLELLGGDAVSAPSANLSGRTSATTAAHVAKDFAHVPDLLVLDGAPCTVGIESTVLDLTQERPAILRPGTVTAEQIAAVLGCAPHTAAATAQGASPGTALGHYAPVTPAQVVGRSDLAGHLAAAADRCAVLAVSLHALPAGEQARHIVVPMPAQAAAYAAVLYDRLRAADASGCARIIIEDPCKEPAAEWAGVRDRLQRATHGGAA